MRDDEWLDDLARLAAGGLPRRAALRRLGGGLAAALLASLGLAEDAAAAPPGPPGPIQCQHPCPVPGRVNRFVCCPPGTVFNSRTCTADGCCRDARVYTSASTGQKKCCPDGRAGCGTICCPPGATCKDGACVCPPLSGGVFGLPRTVCGDTCCATVGIHACCDDQCVSLKTNSDHCGACGAACPSGEACCAGKCADLDTDQKNCGECGRSCPATSSVCQRGDCVCGPGHTPCGNGCCEQLNATCCSGGCCPEPDGVCCPDRTTCCPRSIPVCCGPFCCFSGSRCVNPATGECAPGPAASAGARAASAADGRGGVPVTRLRRPR